MDTLHVIIVFFLTSLLFLIIIGYLLYKYRKEKENEFKKNFPILLEAIKNNDLISSMNIIERLQWNPNMNLKHYLDILNKIDVSGFDIKDAKSIRNKIEHIFIKKGWDCTQRFP